MMTEICFTFPHECSILRPEYGETEYGGDTESRPEVAKNIECFVQNMKIGEVTQWAKRKLDVETKIYFKTEPNLREGDFILITLNTQGTSYVGQQFKFMGVDDATAGHGIAWKAVCKREADPVAPNPPE